MKVFNLACANDHHFEGWFASTEAFESQIESGMVECPVCGDLAVRRLPSAPRLNLSSSSASAAQARQGGKNELGAEQVQALWLRMARHIRDNTEDVGERFASEARRIHYEESPTRGIRGVATSEQAAELAEEGIEVFSFPMPKGSNEPLQ